MTQETHTVKLVLSDKKRRRFLEELIENTSKDLRKIDVGLADITFYSSKDIKPLQSQKHVKDTLLITLLKHQDEGCGLSILDVCCDTDLKEVFKDPNVGPLLTLCAISAGFLTTDSEEAQEEIYLNTGRLAFILCEKKDFKEGKNLREAIKLALEDSFVSDLSYLLEEEVVFKDKPVSVHL